MPGLDWLTARPVAHRGLHNAITVIENTASAVRAAMEANYAIEVDLQVSADGEAMVYHDDCLGRLTHGTAQLDKMTAQALRQATFKLTPDRMLTLGELLDLVGGQVTLLLEMKSRFDNDERLARRLSEVLAGYAGPVAAMSFDPQQVLMLARMAPGLPRGVVAQRRYSPDEWPRLMPAQRRNMGGLRHTFRTKPHFLAYRLLDLPTLPPLIGRYIFGLPLLAWTARDSNDHRRALRWADQIIFEGMRP
jgi:glycerophosphoryl diester phosphodiesterase